MKERRGETIRERLVRVEEQHITDVKLNDEQHKAILTGVNDCKTMLSNHLDHTRKLNNKLMGILIAIVGYWAATKVNGLLHWLAAL